MKRLLYLFFCMILSLAAMAQDDDGPGMERLRDRMQEYIQTKLEITPAEKERFSPLFLAYFRELRATNKQYRTDRLLLQQKLADLRVRHRDNFKTVLGEPRSNDFFKHEAAFMAELKKLRDERRGGGGNNGPRQGNGGSPQ